MDYKRFDDTIFARIDRGEDIVEMLKEISLKEDIKLASVDGLGAIGRLETGLFDTTEKKYYNTCERDGAFEITSLTGTVTTMNGEYYGHLHLSAADGEGNVYGGHLNSAIVSGTCEMVIRIINGRVERKFSDEIGLNLFDFSD